MTRILSLMMVAIASARRNQVGHAPAHLLCVRQTVEMDYLLDLKNVMMETNFLAMDATAIARLSLDGSALEVAAAPLSVVTVSLQAMRPAMTKTLYLMMAVIASVKRNQVGHALVLHQLAYLFAAMVYFLGLKNAMMETKTLEMVATAIARLSSDGNVQEVAFALQSAVMDSSRATRLVMTRTLSQMMVAIANVRKKLDGLALAPLQLAHLFVVMGFFLGLNNATMATRTAEMAVTASARLKPVGSAQMVLTAHLSVATAL
jgi:hypothetical protein